jgi:hypothetical protein
VPGLVMKIGRAGKHISATTAHRVPLKLCPPDAPVLQKGMLRCTGLFSSFDIVPPSSCLKGQLSGYASVCLANA